MILDFVTVGLIESPQFMMNRTENSVQYYLESRSIPSSWLILL